MKKINAYRILFGRQRHRWVNNIKMYLREIGWGSTNWTGLRIGTNGVFL
jgi:hypothetical protein